MTMAWRLVVDTRGCGPSVPCGGAQPGPRCGGGSRRIGHRRLPERLRTDGVPTSLPVAELPRAAKCRRRLHNVGTRERGDNSSRDRPVDTADRCHRGHMVDHNIVDSDGAILFDTHRPDRESAGSTTVDSSARHHRRCVTRSRIAPFVAERRFGVGLPDERPQRGRTQPHPGRQGRRQAGRHGPCQALRWREPARRVPTPGVEPPRGVLTRPSRRRRTSPTGSTEASPSTGGTDTAGEPAAASASSPTSSTAQSQAPPASGSRPTTGQGTAATSATGSSSSTAQGAGGARQPVSASTPGHKSGAPSGGERGRSRHRRVARCTVSPPRLRHKSQ